MAGSRKLPSERTIAFAVSIVRSKPPELTIAEYIQLLRQHVAKGRRENALSSAYRHLDRSSYWRAEFERMKAALESVEGENVDLKREVDGLKEKVASAKQGPVKKRKRVDEDVIPVPRSPKKARRDDGGGKKDDALLNLELDLELTGAGDAGNTIMRSFFQVHSLLKSRQTIDPPALAYQLVEAAEVLPRALSEAIASPSSAGQTAETFSSVIVATGRSFRSLVIGFNKLGQVSDGAERRVTYALVQMYEKLLGLFEDTSAAELHGTGQTTVAQDRSLSKKAKQPANPTVKDVSCLNALTKLLCNMLDVLDAKSESHKTLFEGFAYVVLNSLGPKLYAIVFGDQRRQSVADEIANISYLEEFEEGAETVPKPETTAVQIAKLQAPYLIHLLNHMMTAAPAHLGAIISAKTGKPKAANNKGSLKGALTIVAKERLQRTLVSCMFAQEDADENDPFKDCLSMPVSGGPALPMPKLKGRDVKEWFQEEVWQLLGWEILSREA
ncbi:uncharacterized protein LTR77_007528 [Saxophila tyrrhenica]|uniref:Nucleolar complex-associated protein 3 n=1 Tax=Saxophila tyrrhenica TaxID=1690608 RepID=A0AAV9P8C8_9PEZI|nr:hypothetical protein LTR77_007528 [Saxophila tyrrhenica]